MAKDNILSCGTNACLMASLIFALALLGGAYLIGEGLGAKTGSDEIYVSSEAEKDTIDISATATRDVEPDMLRIQLSIEAEDTSAEGSQEKVASDSDNVMNALYALGIDEEDIKTTYYNVNIMRESHYICENKSLSEISGAEPRSGTDCHWEYVTTGYKTTHTLSVNVDDTSMGGEVVDTAVSAGASEVDSISFTLKPETRAELQSELLAQAASDAKSRAAGIAGALGVSLGEPTSISESYNYDYPRYYPMAMEAAAGSSDSTKISSGQMTISATIQASFEIE